ncbi:MAG: hypothetical protein R3A78_09735 [Polyangiales bacterium]|nr:hypothetical protein [Myxococcales bacterium]
MEQRGTIRATGSERQIKGLARAVRCPVFRVGDHDCLTRAAEEELFRMADVLSEGEVDGPSFHGSTMIAIDLERLQWVVREPLTEELSGRLAASVERSVRVHLRAMRLARAEAERRASTVVLGTSRTEVHVSLRGTRLHLDVDFEAPVLEDFAEAEQAQ